MDRLRGIWKENDYINKINCIVSKLYTLFKDSRWDFEHCVKHLFVLEHNTKEEIIVKQNGYEKKVYFSDKDKNEYYVLFYQLTNGVDIKISDYKKDKDGKWNVVYINPQKCLDKNK